MNPKNLYKEFPYLKAILLYHFIFKIGLSEIRANKWNIFYFCQRYTKGYATFSYGRKQSKTRFKNVSNL
jgi:hypothetical protein